jgi:hypothetical protein
LPEIQSPPPQVEVPASPEMNPSLVQPEASSKCVVLFIVCILVCS